MSQSSESNLDRLERRLHSRKQSETEHSESHLSSADDSDIPKRFQHEGESSHDPEAGPARRETNDSDNNDSNGSFLNKLLGFSILFFVIAFAAAVLSVGLGGSGVSPDKVAIDITGPVSVSAGETSRLDITITNNNQVDLQSAELVIIYPEGTRQPDNAGGELRRLRRQIGTMPAGQTVEETAKASLIGEQGETVQIEVRLEYQVADSNAIFTAESSYSVEISEPPVSVEITSPQQVTAGQPFTLKARVSSNVSQVLNDVLLVANYPFGFSVRSVDPTADYRDYVWQLGDISPGGERQIEITGVFTDSSAASQQSFQFDIGTARTGDNTEIGTLFATQNVTTTLEQPFISVDLRLDTSQDRSGNRLSVNADLDWRSNLDSLVRGGIITAQLTGSGIDYNSVTSPTGLFRASEQAVVWNSRTTPALNTISPGDGGTLQFDFNTVDSTDLAGSTENPTVTLSVNLQAEAPDSSSLPNPVTASLERTIRLPSVVRLTADTLHEDGPFTNSGPTPPAAEETTTYTLHLSVSNTTNTIENAQFQAAVPGYVEVDQSRLTAGNVSYNTVSGRLQWSIGQLAAGAGYRTAPQEIFIPISVTPTQNRVGDILPLLEDLSVTGTDTSTGEAVQITDINRPTTARDDLRSDGDSGRVQP